MSETNGQNGSKNGVHGHEAKGVPVELKNIPPVNKNGFKKLFDTNVFVGTFSLLIILVAGCGFIFKLFEFARSIDPNEHVLFAVMPITTYLIVASGFMCLFIWAFLSGKFADLEAAKYDMLEQEEAYERASNAKAQGNPGP